MTPIYRGALFVFRRTFATSRPVLSAHIDNSRRTIADLSTLYRAKEPITFITAHDYLTAQFAEAADIDAVLVGDSLAMTTLGLADTNALDLDEFTYHVKLVARGCLRPFLIADMPFGSFEQLHLQAMATAIRLVKHCGVQAVKIEGAHPDLIPLVKSLVNFGIPVMGHVGLTPQSHNALGGFRLQGNAVSSALSIFEDCKRLQDAGVFSIIMECIPSRLAHHITNNLTVPTIGIGAGQHTLGQVLVIADALGMMDPETSHKPKFLKQYADVYNVSVDALKQYKQEVKQNVFPADQHGYKMKKEIYDEYIETTQTK